MENLHDNCKYCKLYTHSTAHFITGKCYAPSLQDVKLMILSESPINGRVMSGPSERLLKSILKKCGILKYAYVTNILKCPTLYNKRPSIKQINFCRPLLDKEIQKINPKVIVCMGNIVVKSILGTSGVAQLRGQAFPIFSTGFCVPTYHLSAAQRNENLIEKIVEDMLIAKQIILQKQNKLSKTKVHIAGSFLDLKKFKKLLLKQSKLSFDIETNTSNCWNESGKILCCGFSFKKGLAYVLPSEGPDYTEKEFIRVLKEILESNVQKIAHNAKFDCLFPRVRYGIYVKNLYFDTMLAHYLLNEIRGTHGLKKLCRVYTSMEAYESKMVLAQQIYGKSDAFSKINPIDLYEYNGGDCDCTYRLYKEFSKQLNKNKRRKKLHDFLIIPLIHLLMDIEHKGIYVSKLKLQKLKKLFKKKIEDAKNFLYSISEVKEAQKQLNYEVLRKAFITYQKNLEDYKKGIRKNVPKFPKVKEVVFNLKSNKHLSLLLYNVIGLEVIKKTKKTGSPSVDSEVLEKFENSHIFCKKLIEYRKLEKLYSTYIENLDNYIAKDGRVHPDYYIHGTVTGRLSARNPNVLNIPRVDSGGKEIRDLYCAPKGYILIEADYAQIEMRVMAWYANDKTLIKSINSGIDIHRAVAAEVFNCEPEEVTKKQRQSIKSLNFGLIYGRGAKSISEELGWSMKKTQKFIQKYFKRFSGIEYFINRQKRFAKKYGYVESFFGRVRHLPNINSPDMYLRAEAERQAVNAPIQSTASDLTLFSAIKLNNYFKKNNIDAHIINIIYDSILTECREDLVDEVIKIKKKIMETWNFSWVKTKIDTDIKVGKFWGSLEKVKEV